MLWDEPDDICGLRKFWAILTQNFLSYHIHPDSSEWWRWPSFIAILSSKVIMCVINHVLHDTFRSVASSHSKVINSVVIKPQMSVWVGSNLTSPRALTIRLTQHRRFLNSSNPTLTWPSHRDDGVMEKPNLWNHEIK